MHSTPNRRTLQVPADLHQRLRLASAVTGERIGTIAQRAIAAELQRLQRQTTRPRP